MAPIANWAHYLGHPGSTQHSRLGLINKDNVHRLEEVWTYETGDAAEYQTNNLIVEGVLYTATPSRRVTALDAATAADPVRTCPVARERPCDISTSNRFAMLLGHPLWPRPRV